MTRLISILISCLLLINCEGPEGPIGPQGNESLIKTTKESIGNNCSDGGIKVETGVDNNRNEILDVDEIDNTTFLCNGIDGLNGVDGKNALIKSTPELPGTNCTNGGFLIVLGIDVNKTGILDSEEIQYSTYICNGINASTDKQVRVNFGGPNSKFNSTDQWTVDTYGPNFLIKFDKRNYSNIDSILFCAAIGSIPFEIGLIAYADLYNLTDQVPISNSQIQSNGVTDLDIICSKNILNDLPNKEVTLTIRLKSGINGKTAYAPGNSRMLLIYKK